MGVERIPIMTKISLTRRQLAQLAVAGAAGALLPAPVHAQDTETPPMPAPSLTTAHEADMLAQAVPLNVGYTLTKTQAKEVAGALKNSLDAFGKARTYPIPDDAAPSWVSVTPPALDKKGRGK